MLPLPLPETSRPLRVLLLGAHADDIEIGAGATLLQLQTRRDVIVRAAVFSASQERRVEAEISASMLFERAVEWSLDVFEFAENLFPAQVTQIKGALAELRSFGPDVVFTHRHADRHQDHRVLGEVTWQAFRDHVILQYEIPKWEGDLTSPNAYVGIGDAVLERKIDIIERAFVSQRDKAWFDADTFRGLARLRGVECGQRWAEAFQLDKIVIVPQPSTSS